MSRISFYLFVCFVFVLQASSGSTSIFHFNMMRDGAETGVTEGEVVYVKELPNGNEVLAPVEIAEEELPEKVKPCAKVGEFCMSKSDCCTPLLCLGFLKRCVT